MDFLNKTKVVSSFDKQSISNVLNALANLQPDPKVDLEFYGIWRTFMVLVCKHTKTSDLSESAEQKNFALQNISNVLNGLSKAGFYDSTCVTDLVRRVTDLAESNVAKAQRQSFAMILLAIANFGWTVNNTEQKSLIVDLWKHTQTAYANEKEEDQQSTTNILYALAVLDYRPEGLLEILVKQAMTFAPDDTKIAGGYITQLVFYLHLFL